MSRISSITAILAALCATLFVAPAPATAAKKQAVLPRTIVQVAEIPLLYRDEGSMKHRHRGRLLYWDENGVRIFVRLADMVSMADKRDSRCAFDNNAWQETLAVTLEHIPSAGRDVDLKRYYDTFIVGTLTNDERMDMTITHKDTMAAWDRNLQDVIRIIGTAGAKQAMECLAMLGHVAAQDIAAETFHNRLYWRQETLADGKTLKYFFVARDFFPTQAD